MQRTPSEETMRYLLLTICLLVPSLAALSQDPEPQVESELRRLRLSLNPEFESWDANHVLDLCAAHLASLPRELRSNIRYLDFSASPREYLPAAMAGSFFWTNSMSAIQLVGYLRPVPETDNRILFLDLEDFGWTAEAWEKVAGDEVYYREPWIPSNSKALAYLKGAIGNGVIRGDWFLYWSADTSLYLRDGETKNDNSPYYILTYAKNKAVQKKKERVKDKDGKIVEREIEKEVLGAIPQTAEEFEKFWLANDAVTGNFPLDRAGIVDQGSSIVSLHNRVLRRRRTALGTYWRTFDVIRGVGDQDFIESLPIPPKKYDASEHIVTDSKGSQHYFLSNGKGDRIEFGDPRVVRDMVSGGPPIVVTGKSCVACHAEGIIPFENEVPKILAAGTKLYPKNARIDQDLQLFYLQNIGRQVRQDQDEYAEFVAKVNGLGSAENAAQFAKIRDWYSSPLTPEQAARELGASIDEFEAAVSLSGKGRLARLITDGKPIPRTVWEFGGFQEAALLLLEHRKNAKMWMPRWLYGRPKERNPDNVAPTVPSPAFPKLPPGVGTQPGEGRSLPKSPKGPKP